MKRCSKCKKRKKLKFFYRRKRSKDGYKSQCMDCDKAYYNLHRTKFLILMKEYRINNRDELLAYGKQYYIDNKDELLDNMKEYRENNPEKIKEIKKQYKEKNREKIKRYAKKYNKKYYRDRLKTDINFKLVKRLRTRLYSALKNNQKSGSAVRDLGCSIPELKIYIESLWLPGMSWYNWGYGNTKWHLDHIIPLNSFDLFKREQLLKACHYTNLQPLWQQDNLSKSNKI